MAIHKMAILFASLMMCAALVSVDTCDTEPAATEGGDSAMIQVHAFDKTNSTQNQTTPASGWRLVFRQTAHVGNWLFQANEWSRNANDVANANFAILDRLEQFRESGAFEFKLSWPANGLSDQIWKQTSNPVTSTSGGVSGYQAISVPYTSYSWGGLERHTGTATLIDGSVNTGNWLYSVGSRIEFDGGIPGPSSAVSKVELYVKTSNQAMTQVAKLTAADGADEDYFGLSLAISSDGSRVAVGAYGDDDKGSKSGSAYLFDGAGTELAKLTAADGAAGDQFGRSLAISSDGSRVAVGAYGDDDKGSNSGSAYLFEAPTPPTQAPTTAAATSSPTAAPTAAPVMVQSVSAIGDPHMQNILGQRFDLMQPGKHTLIQIPRFASDSDALLRVMADAEHEGSSCADVYFKALNITGEWVSAYQKDGYMYTADAPQTVASWRTFGKVEMKVAWGRTLGGVEYLNFFVRHLKRVGHDIGGLLGMDDYTHAAKRNPLCNSILDFYSASWEVSFAMADM